MALNDPYFTAAEFKTRYPDVIAEDATIDSYRALAEEAIEHACGVAFVPRAATLANVRPGDGAFLLAYPLRTITTVSADGTDWSVDQVAALKWDNGGIVDYNWGASLVSIAYEHGYDAPPLRVKQAAMILTRVWLVSGPVDQRATQIPTETGGSINLATPGMFGATFGIPEVDATVEQYRQPVIA